MLGWAWYGEKEKVRKGLGLGGQSRTGRTGRDTGITDRATGETRLPVAGAMEWGHAKRGLCICTRPWPWPWPWLGQNGGRDPGEEGL